MPQFASRLRLSSSLIMHATSSRAAPNPATLPISARIVLACTIDMVIGRRPVIMPLLLTQMTTLSPFAAPGVIGTMPDLVAPDGASHLAATQEVVSEPYPGYLDGAGCVSTALTCRQEASCRTCRRPSACVSTPAAGAISGMPIRNPVSSTI